MLHDSLSVEQCQSLSALVSITSCNREVFCSQQVADVRRDVSLGALIPACLAFDMTDVGIIWFFVTKIHHETEWHDMLAI